MSIYGFMHIFLTKDSNHYNQLFLYILALFLNIYMMFFMKHLEPEDTEQLT
jgi:hypothetical protein